MDTRTSFVKEANNRYREWVRRVRIDVDGESHSLHIAELSRERTAGMVRISFHVSRYDKRWVVMVQALSRHPDALCGFFYMIEAKR